jgi:hypothetical protein
MTDTWIRVHVYKCPDDQLEAAAVALRDKHDLSYEHADMGGIRLDLGEPLACDINDYEVPDIAKDLRDAAPGCSYRIWTDPVEGELGALFAYTPELGMYGADCDGSGDAVASLDRVMEVAGKPSVSQIRQALYNALGGPWKADFEENRRDTH